MFRLGFVLRNAAVISSCMKNSAPLLREVNSNIYPKRNTSFFNKVTAEDLWRGVTSVSNAGKKRGRGKGQDRKLRKNFNRGQLIGVGKENILWPGLTTPLIQSNTIVNIQKLPPSEKPPQTDPIITKKSKSVHPLERGWSGKSIVGRSLGPPDPDGDMTFDDFDCIVVKCKVMLQMTSVFGKRRKISAIVLSGNGKGLIGMGKCMALDSHLAVKKAKKKSVKRLLAFNFSNNYSVNHSFFCQFGRLKLYVYQAPEGYGLKCQRVLATCCKLIGIKNVRIKIEGNTTNTLHVIKAFLIGLMQQKTPEEIANEGNLHLVEFADERYHVPKVLASPKKLLTPDELSDNPITYEDIIWKGKTVLKRVRNPERKLKSVSYQKYLKKTDYIRNRPQTQIDLLKEYGSLVSHLTEKYPECRGMSRRRTKKAAQE